jgi:prepilin-type N-terminal cleavage/methylation domain-containing protein
MGKAVRGAQCAVRGSSCGPVASCLVSSPPRTAPRAPRPGAKRPAFTLVEVLVAAAVLAIGVSAGVRTLGAMARASAAASDRQAAVRLAGERLATLEGIEGVSAGNSEGSFDNEPRFRWRQQVGAAAQTGVLEATVTISWQEGALERHYAVTTYLLDPAQQTTTGSGQ